jgi:hypothetical protein
MLIKNIQLAIQQLPTQWQKELQREAEERQGKEEQCKEQSLTIIEMLIKNIQLTIQQLPTQWQKVL